MQIKKGQLLEVNHSRKNLCRVERKEDGSRLLTAVEVVKQLEMIDKEAGDTREFTRRVCELLVEWQAKLKE